MMSDGGRGLVLDTDKLVEALERAIQNSEDSGWRVNAELFGEALAIARQLIEENERLKGVEKAIAFRVAEFKQENKRLKRETALYPHLQAHDVDLQSRLSAAEEERDRAIQSCASLRAGKENALDQLKRAEEMVAAAKRHVDKSYTRVWDAIRRYEEER